MAYDEYVLERVREHLTQKVSFEEKKMMGGLCFMVNDKMCIGVDVDKQGANRLMCRLDPDDYLHLLEKPGASPMDFTGRPLKGYVFIADFAFEEEQDLAYWLDLALAFNPKAKASKKRKKKATKSKSTSKSDNQG